MLRLSLSLAALFTAAFAQADDLISLDSYLNQVSGANPAARAGDIGFTAGAERSGDASLLFSPTLFFNLQLASDGKLPQIPIYSYEDIVTNTYSLGISQLTTFGLTAKVHYDSVYTSFVNPVIPGQGPTTVPSFYQTTPVVELTQNLLAGGFGRTARASRDLSEANARASSYSYRYQRTSTLVDAETTYWRLSTARQSVKVSADALARARKIFDWSARRSHLHLADQADALQAEALVRVRELELQSAQDDARVASRAFNLARNMDSDTVPETLLAADGQAIAGLRLPDAQKTPVRDDVRAAREQSRAAVASAQLSYEKDMPTLDIYGSYALNSHQDGSLGPSLTDPYSTGRPTRAIGIRFSAPLAVGTVSTARSGWAREQAAADLNYAKKVIDQTQGWSDLVERFQEARHRLELNHAIEQAQKFKLAHERERLGQGRTTTYQVLLFEEDFAQAQLNLIGAQRDVLTLYAQTKLYGDQP